MVQDVTTCPTLPAPWFVHPYLLRRLSAASNFSNACLAAFLSKCLICISVEWSGQQVAYGHLVIGIACSLSSPIGPIRIQEDLWRSFWANHPRGQTMGLNYINSTGTEYVLYLSSWWLCEVSAVLLRTLDCSTLFDKEYGVRRAIIPLYCNWLYPPRR